MPKYIGAVKGLTIYDWFLTVKWLNLAIMGIRI